MQVGDTVEMLPRPTLSERQHRGASDLSLFAAGRTLRVWEGFVVQRWLVKFEGPTFASIHERWYRMYCRGE